MPKTLYEYYSSKGQKLPTVAERAPLASQYGIQNYSGTAEQNAILLSKLSAEGSSAANLPPLPSANTPDAGGVVPGGADPQQQSLGDLGNLRIALREALNEAARKRVENNYKIVAPASGAIPGTIGSVVDMIRGGIKPTVEQTFSDIVGAFKDANDAKQKELDRINELRLEFGSAVPSSVTDLATALDLVTPLVDKERAMKLEKMRKEQEGDNDIESWADFVAKGGSIGSVPSGIRTAVRVRADAIVKTLETEATQNEKDMIVLRIEKKLTDFETERGTILGDDRLTAAEKRQMIDYVDGLESQLKTTKKSGGKGIFNSILGGGNSAPARPSAGVYGRGNFAQISIDDRIKQLTDMLGTGYGGANKTYLEQTLSQNGYDPQEIMARTRTNIIDKIFR